MKISTIAFGALTIVLSCNSAAVSRTYLLSIRMPRPANQYIYGFKIETWGVTLLAVCHVPTDWRITAGNFEDPEGVLSGETKEGRPAPARKEFTGIALVELDEYQPEARGSQPATFAGSVDVAPFGDVPAAHKIPFKTTDFVRSAASACPAR